MSNLFDSSTNGSNSSNKSSRSSHASHEDDSVQSIKDAIDQISRKHDTAMQQQAQTNKLILERLLNSGTTKRSKHVRDSGPESYKTDKTADKKLVDDINPLVKVVCQLNQVLILTMTHLLALILILPLQI